MSQTFRYVSPGLWSVDLGTDAVRLGTITGLVTTADTGQVGMSTIVLDNPSGTVGHSSDQIVGWKLFTDDESAEAVGNQRVYTGYVTDRTYRRRQGSSLITGPANEIEINLNDQNDLLGRLIITGADGIRPSETVDARIAWLLASTYLAGLVTDDAGFVASSTVVMDACDYTGQKPADVLLDCGLAAQFNHFVLYWEATDTASLWFDSSNSSSAWPSGMSISNDLSDIDPAAITNGTATVFYPMIDAELRRDPTRCYSGVYLPYAKGHVYVTDATIGSNFTPRDGSAPNSNVKTSAAATAIANDFLGANATEDDRITCTIQVNKAQVNAILAGQLVSAKFTHFPNYTAFSSFRVMQRSVAQSVETDDIYQVQLVLSPACIATEPPIQSFTTGVRIGANLPDGENYDFASYGGVDPTPGNTMFAIFYGTGGGTIAPAAGIGGWPDGWVQDFYSGPILPGGPYSMQVEVRHKLVQVGDTGLDISTAAAVTNTYIVHMLEVPGNVPVIQEVHAYSPGTTIDIPAITTTGDSLLLGVHQRVTSADPVNHPTGWTDEQFEDEPLGDRQLVETMWQQFPAGTLGATSFAGGVEDADICVFVILQLGSC